MTVDEMLERISSTELVRWQAFYELEKEDEDHNTDHSRRVNSFK